MEMKSKLLTATALIGLAATSASANTIYFKQTDEAGSNSVGIGAMTIEQDYKSNTIGTSATDSLIEGALATLTIKQLENTATSALGTNNAADFAVYGSDTSTSGTLVSTFSGNGNNWDLSLGASGDTVRYVNPDYALTVTGNNNVVNDVLANGAAGTDTFDYVVSVSGDGNDLSTKSSAGVGSVDVAYTVSGNNNAVLTAFGSTSGGRAVDLTLTGSNNDLTINAQSATSSAVDLTVSGNSVTALISQTGTSSSMVADVTNSGSSALNMSTTAIDSGQSADITLVAADGGSFTLNQAAANAVYNAAHNIAAGGSVTVNQ